ncbi:MAG: MBL fold metallo-hydrolase [Chloroflexi bacterium]|nr:MBL fold metallo-hydrolase [Chloroflexota bacterium]
MTSHSLRVGSVEIVEFLDTPMAFPFGAFFPSVPAQEFEAYKQVYPQSHAPDGRFQTYAQCYLVRSDGRTVLVDTGVGPGPIEWLGGAGGRLLDDMSGKGVKLEDVDTVVFTHLHGDHVGWNVRREGGGYRATFPRARYLVPQADWDHFTSPAMLEQSGAKQTVVPLKGLGALDLFSGEITLAEGVTTIPTPGHTPGHTSVLVSSQGERAIITGDLAHHPAQVDQTEWCSAFDGESPQAIESRSKVFEQLESEGLTAAICHFPPPGFGKLVRLEGRRVFRAL